MGASPYLRGPNLAKAEFLPNSLMPREQAATVHSKYLTAAVLTYGSIIVQYGFLHVSYSV